MIADDDDLVREALGLLLDADPRFALVAAASDGREALEAVVDHDPDVVVLDVAMPRMDGVAVAAEIRARSERIAIVMLSGERRRRGEAERAGATTWIDKPADARTITARILAGAGVPWT